MYTYISLITLFYYDSTKINYNEYVICLDENNFVFASVSYRLSIRIVLAHLKCYAYIKSG